MATSPAIQAALLLVQQTVEQQNGGFEFFGGDLEGRGISHQGHGAGSLPGADLVARLPAVGGGIEEAAGHLRSSQTSGGDQVMERILNFGMERVGQFVGGAAARSLIDEGLNGSDEGAVTGEPDGIVICPRCMIR